MDGDGIEDLMVGAHYNDDAGMLAGAAYLVHGGTTGELGDLDGDGLGDLLVGAYQESGGSAYFFSGADF